MKQNFFDFNLVKKEWQVFSIIATISGFIFMFIEIDRTTKIYILASFILGFSLIYIILYLYFKFWSNHINIQIGKVNLNIKVGDIFEEKGMKVIPVNEYFDTKVDDIIISQNSLHGMFVKKYIINNELKKLNSNIKERLEGHKYEENTERKDGKKKKYKIGTTLIVDNYILTALTKFNEKNEAYLSMNEYLNFLNIFWNEINRIHNGRVINVPVLGTGISRINPALSEQEFLEQIVLSLKTSELITSKSKINIIIYEGNKEKISLVRIKDKF